MGRPVSEIREMCGNSLVRSKMDFVRANSKYVELTSDGRYKDPREMDFGEH